VYKAQSKAPVANASKEMVEQSIAMHYYVTGTSFARIEEGNLLTALKVLRSDVQLPSRKKLAGPVLENAFIDVKKKCSMLLDNATFCITSDGWMNVRNDPIVNYMATSPRISLFLESLSTGEQGHNADWIATDIHRVMTPHAEYNFRGCHHRQYVYEQECLEAALDITPFCLLPRMYIAWPSFAIKTKKADDVESTYPLDYPFEHLLDFIVDCKDIVKLFRNNHVLKAQLDGFQKIAGVRSLIRPAPTRWGTIKACLLLREFYILLRLPGSLSRERLLRKPSARESRWSSQVTNSSHSWRNQSPF